MDLNELIHTYHLKLNEQQKKAVLETNGALLLLAVPGSGKTTVIVSRIGYLLKCQKVEPENILTLTYSVAAAKDMKERFIKVFQNEYENRLEFRTINSFCLKIIKEYEVQKNKKAFSLIQNANEIIARLYFKNAKDYANETIIKEILTKIAYCKNRMLKKEEIDKIKVEGVHFAKIYQEYEAYKIQNKLMDFDDQLVYAYKILKLYPDILNKIKRKYLYINVDEAQDTSKLQHEIIHTIVGKNIFMVGDEDQSIYQFRAAYPQALLDFEKTYQHAKVLLMETNYRSTPQIVEVANQFIKQNKKRKEKEMKTNQQKGKEIIHKCFTTMQEQYDYLLKSVENINQTTAILYRNNDLAIPIINVLAKHDIAFEVREQDTNFFTDKIVEDIKRIIAFAQDRKNFALFEKIYFKLNCGISKGLVKDVYEIWQKKHEDLFDIILDNFELPLWQVRRLVNVQRELMSLPTKKPFAMIQTIMENIEYKAFLESRASVEQGIFSYQQKVNVLYAIAKTTEHLSEWEERLIQLEGIIKKGRNEYNSKVILSTIHASKGLEYDKVILVDVIDGVLPSVSKNTKEKQEEYDEEVRLFYVGMTRAKKELEILTYKRDFGFELQTSEFIKYIFAKNKGSK